MHKNELFFDLVFLVTPLDPPLSLPPPYTPPRGRSIGDPCYSLHVNNTSLDSLSRDVIVSNTLLVRMTMNSSDIPHAGVLCKEIVNRSLIESFFKSLIM